MYPIPTCDELDKLYNGQNVSVEELAHSLNICVLTVRRWLRYRGIKIGHKKKSHIPFSKEELAQLYCNEHMSQSKIAEKCGFSQATIGHWMIKLGIPRRTTSELTSGSSNPFYGKNHTPESKEKERNSGYHKNLSGSNNPFYGKHHSEKALAKMMKARQVKPNRAELKLNSIIHNLSTDYEYNGDFRRGIAIGGKIPDWVNVNGQKKLVELLGHGWHIQNKWFKVSLTKTEDYIIEHYKKYGWACLTISDYELKNETLLGDKISKFIGAN